MIRTRCMLATACFVGSVAAVARAQEAVRSDGADASSPRHAHLDARLDLSGPVPFGTRGQAHFSVMSGAALNIEDDTSATDVPVSFAYNRFLVDDIEIAADLTIWGHIQDGDDAIGFNPVFNLRWHFLNRDRWTLFADVGIGLLASTDDVPDGGTSFNFTPRAGGGGTLRLTDAGLRLIGGVRWHHISNARIEGERDNPDRDGVLVYAGFMFPF